MCEKLGCLISNLLYFGEKFAVSLAGVTLVGCIILTLIMMLALGIGLGYNYCYVDYQTRSRYRFIPPHYSTVEPLWIHENESTTEETGKLGSLRIGEDAVSLTTQALHELPSTLSSIVETNAKVPKTYFAIPSTKIIYEKPNLNFNLGTAFNTSVSPSPQLLNFYKFWALPLKTTTTTESATTKDVNNEEKLNDTAFIIANNGTVIEVNDTDIHVTDTYITDTHITDTHVTDKYTKDTIQEKKLISINGMDLMALLSQLRAENRNYSLQILTS